MFIGIMRSKIPIHMGPLAPKTATLKLASSPCQKVPHVLAYLSGHPTPLGENWAGPYTTQRLASMRGEVCIGAASLLSCVALGTNIYPLLTDDHSEQYHCCFWYSCMSVLTWCSRLWNGLSPVAFVSRLAKPIQLRSLVVYPWYAHGDLQCTIVTRSILLGHCKYEWLWVSANFL